MTPSPFLFESYPSTNSATIHRLWYCVIATRGKRFFLTHSVRKANSDSYRHLPQSSVVTLPLRPHYFQRVMLFRKLPQLSALAAFEAVARHRSFTNAGKELFLTHGAVSQRISLLEKHLNARLLVRSNRAVELTAEGARYLEAVCEALSKLTSASDQFSQRGSRGFPLR